MLFKIIYEYRITEGVACWGPILHERHYEQWLSDHRLQREQYFLGSVFDQEKQVKLPSGKGYATHKEYDRSIYNIIVFHRFSPSLVTAFGLFSDLGTARDWIREYRKQPAMQDGFYASMYLQNNHIYRGM